MGCVQEGDEFSNDWVGVNRVLILLRYELEVKESTNDETNHNLKEVYGGLTSAIGTSQCCYFPITSVNGYFHVHK